MSDLGNKTIMALNIRRLMDEKGIDRNILCADLDIKYTTLCDWINAKTYPRIDKIEMMANYFGVEKSDLVDDPSTKKTNDFPEDVRAAARGMMELSATDRALAINMIKSLAQKGKEAKKSENT